MSTTLNKKYTPGEELPAKLDFGEIFQSELQKPCTDLGSHQASPLITKQDILEVGINLDFECFNDLPFLVNENPQAFTLETQLPASISSYPRNPNKGVIIPNYKKDKHRGGHGNDNRERYNEGGHQPRGNRVFGQESPFNSTSPIVHLLPNPELKPEKYEKFEKNDKEVGRGVKGNEEQPISKLDQLFENNLKAKMVSSKQISNSEQTVSPQNNGNAQAIKEFALNIGNSDFSGPKSKAPMPQKDFWENEINLNQKQSKPISVNKFNYEQTNQSTKTLDSMQSFQNQNLASTQASKSEIMAFYKNVQDPPVKGNSKGSLDEKFMMANKLISPVQQPEKSAQIIPLNPMNAFNSMLRNNQQEEIVNINQSLNFNVNLNQFQHQHQPQHQPQPQFQPQKAIEVNPFKNIFSTTSPYNKIMLFNIFHSLFDLDQSLGVWHYKDPLNQIQGPFTSMEMDLWNLDGYFQPLLQISWLQTKKFYGIQEFKNEPAVLYRYAIKYYPKPIKFAEQFASVSIEEEAPIFGNHVKQNYKSAMKQQPAPVYKKEKNIPQMLGIPSGVFISKEPSQMQSKPSNNQPFYSSNQFEKERKVEKPFEMWEPLEQKSKEEFYPSTSSQYSKAKANQEIEEIKRLYGIIPKKTNEEENSKAMTLEEKFAKATMRSGVNK